MKLLFIIFHRVWYLDTEAIENWLAFFSIFAGCWLLLPFETISVPFNQFEGIENGVAIWLVVLGSYRFHAVYNNIQRRRAGCAMASFATWLFLLYLSLMVDYRALVVVYYLMMCLTSIWVYLRSPAHLSPFSRRRRGRTLENPPRRVADPPFDSSR